MKNDIFLSYSHHDAAVAKSLKQALKRLKFSVWDAVDKTKPGTNWNETILNAIQRSDAIIVLWSANAAASSWINYEVGAASALGKDVVVLKSPSYSVSDLPRDLAGWRVINFDPKSPADTARTLASSLANAA